MGAGDVFLGAASAVFSVVDVVHVLMYSLYFASASRANVFLWCHWSFRVDILGATGLDGLVGGGAPFSCSVLLLRDADRHNVI